MASRARVAMLLGVAVAVVAAAVLVWRLSSSDTELTRAAAACDDENDTVSVSGDGTSLSVEGGGASTAVLTTEGSACVLAQLRAPDDVQTAIRAAAADGESRTERFGDYEIEWTRSRDRGLELSVEKI